MAFDANFYANKKAKVNDKIQRLNNYTFTTFLQLASSYFNQNAEMQEELKEIEQLTQKAMSDETTTPATTPATEPDKEMEPKTE